MYKAFEVIKSVLVWVVIVSAVALMLFTVFSVTAFDNSERNLFGYKAFVVLSDSMSEVYPGKPGYFDTGDVVVSKKVPPETLEAGDIISFLSDKDDGMGSYQTVTVTHMIRERITLENGEQAFVTYGTTTGVDDESVVTYDDVLGKYQFRIVGLGRLFYFLKSPLGYMLCIFVPFLLMIIVQVIRVTVLFKQYREEEIAEIEHERTELEEQKRQSADIMKEIALLREQLAKRQDDYKDNSD